MPYLLALTLLLSPSYAIRFNLGPLPTNFLMLWVVFVWIVFAFRIILKNQISQALTAVKACDQKILVFSGLFLLAGLISLFWQGFTLEKLGQFIVLFVQPISLFVIGTYLWQQNPKSKHLLLTTCYLLLALMGIYSIIQYFTLFSLPAVYWGNSIEPKRALAFFSHPNFYSLFSAPLLAFLIPNVAESLKFKILNLKSIAWALGAVGLGLSLSRAGWLGLGMAGLVYLIFAADKKIRKLALAAVIVMVIVILSVPNLRWRFALPFYGEKSAVSRMNLWKTGWKGVEESPVLGLGLAGFSKNWNRLNTDPGLDTHNYPHNIFLNLWVETGVIGLVGLIGLIGLIIYRGLKNRNDAYKLGIALFLITILFQGLLDNPYFKNDLALVFWLIVSLTYANTDKKT
jgi:O-antigen ligase